MPSLSEEVAAKKKAQSQTQDPPRNSQTDAEIDAFIKENPKTFERVNSYSKEYLVRQKMLAIKNAHERRNGRDQEIREWVKNTPEIEQRVAERVKHVPEQNRERAFLNVARKEAERAGMRAPRP